MKKLFLILLTIATFAIGADVKPFTFAEPVGQDSASQQETYNYLLKYKLFGRDYITIGNDVVIQDKSGWNGTAGYMTANARLTLGGPTLVAGDITYGDQPTLTSGPVRANTYTYGNQNGACINGYVCLNDLSNSKVNHCSTDSVLSSTEQVCVDNVPPAPTGLSIPTITWPDTISQSIIFKPENGEDQNKITKTIVVPDGKEQYDIYLDTIQYTADGQKLKIEMQDGGRLTRIFVKHFLYHTHGQIQVVYRTDSTNYELSQKDYRGNVIIYTDESISITESDNAIMQGTIISTKEIYLACNINFAGQLLANQLRIGNTYNGENFRFVKFDPDTIDVKLDKYGGLRENDSTVTIPIELSDTTDINVYFTYCIDLKDGVTVDDFNIPPTFPICNNGEKKTVAIPTGEKVPNIPIQINVKVDTLTEPNDILVLKITDISGAILPNGKTNGELKIKIIDAPNKHVEFDTTAIYKFHENDTGFVSAIKIVNETQFTRFYLDSSWTDRYTLDSITGELRLVKDPLDYEATTVDMIKVTLKDTGNVEVSRLIPIGVIDVNEAPTLNDTTFTLYENVPVPSLVGTLKVNDPDKTTEFRQNLFKIVEGDSCFTIDNTGKIYSSKIFNYEKDTTEFTLKVMVYDKNYPTVLFDTATVTIKIGNTNEGPKFQTKDTTLYVAENTKPGIIGNVAAKDEDGDTITYKIVGNVPFTIDTAGNISSTREFDFEKETGFTFKVVATSTDLTDTMKVTVKVTNENEPVHINDTTFTVKENYTGPIGKVEGKDEDGEPIKYTISDTTNYYISSVGSITLKTPFDYETKNTDTVTVYVTTPSGDKDSAKVVIKVQNVNETPVLQPNDTLTVPENCKNCIVGIITATDPDKDPIKYTVKEPGFTIDSAGVLRLTEPLDYEKTPVVTITVTATDPSGAGDTATYKIKVTDINEPVHTKDTTCSVKENYTGNVCKIPGTDDDGTKPTFIVTDTTNYKIDSTGQLVIKNPIDYEKKTKDTVKVIVTDGDFYDTATVIINVIDEDEIPEITKIDDKQPVDTIKTNDPDHKIDYQICEGDNCDIGNIDITVHKDTTVKVCNTKKTKCDSVVILFNDAPPVVTLTNAKSTDAYIDYITIEEQKDDKIYVNKKENPITVTVKDTIHKTEKHFEIKVKLDTIPTKDIKLKEYNYLIDETKAIVKPIGGNKGELVEVIKDNGTEVTIKQIIDLKTGKPIDTVQTVSYTKKVNGKEVVVTYKTDNLTGQKIGDYEVSYMVDSCTKVTYTMNDKKQIIKNKEGNISYTITYDYVDDFGNKASASVEIVYDDIPPKVEILEPYEHEIFKTNAIPVKWTVNGEVQDTLTLQRLEKGVNYVIRRYVDKAGNEADDTVWVIMKEAKDIDITIIHPVTEINKDKVDEFFTSTGEKYDPKKPYKVTMVNPKDDSLPETIGIGFKIDIALPSVSATGNVSTLSDIIKNDKIPVDYKGNVVGASNLSIPVEKYINENCTDDFRQDYHKNGPNIPLYNVKYKLHLWIYTSNANYVNDFEINYDIDSKTEANAASIANFVIDWIPEKDGNVKAKNQHSLGTGAYLVKLYSKSTAIYRCGFKNQKAGDKITKKEYNLKSFGYKRPNK